MTSLTATLLIGGGACAIAMASVGRAQAPPLPDPGPRASDAADVRPGFRVIDSIAEFRACMSESGQKIRMRPGTYLVEHPWPDDPKCVFLCTGSDNHFDLRGVTIQIDTAILAAMPRTPAHQLGVYRVKGSRLTFEGATFEDVGNHPPRRSLSEFTVSGDDVLFRDCTFVTRGSSPYGYGDLYGKGAGAAVWLQKHSAIGILGDRCVIEWCRFRIHTFGHAIHMHGAQDTVIRHTWIEGDLRLADALYEEDSGPAAEHDYKVMFPPWRKGQPIPRHTMLSLTEDGIRAYVYGNDREGNRRRTGHITVENCRVDRMRGGITICMAANGTVTDCTVTNSGYPGHAYSIPSDGVVRNCRGDVSYAPLLIIPYKQTRRADIELNLLRSNHSIGDHPLARVVGDDGHRIRITWPYEDAPAQTRPIIIGSVGDRYTPDNTPEEDLERHHMATKITLENRTPHPVVLTKYSSLCHISSDGPVKDRGKDNTIVE